MFSSFVSVCDSATNNSNSNGGAKRKKINDGDQKVRKKSEGLLRTKRDRVSRQSSAL